MRRPSSWRRRRPPHSGSRGVYTHRCRRLATDLSLGQAVDASQRCRRKRARLPRMQGGLRATFAGAIGAVSTSTDGRHPKRDGLPHLARRFTRGPKPHPAGPPLSRSFENPRGPGAFRLGASVHGWPMEQMVFQEYLAKADRNVREGERDVARQLQVVDDLERNGLDTGKAMELLLQFEEMLATCIPIGTDCGGKSVSGCRSAKQQAKRPHDAKAANAARRKSKLSTFGSITMRPFPPLGPTLPGHRRVDGASTAASR